jgi:hypothetical protein
MLKTGSTISLKDANGFKQRCVKISQLLLRIFPAGSALLATHSLLFGQSVAYYRHDWGWPATSAQLSVSFWRNVGLWDSSGLGSPNYEPLLHPVFVFWHIFAGAATPDLLLGLTLYFAFAAYGYGVAMCCRMLFRLPFGVAFAVGAVAILGPPLYNKTVAGHVYYLIALASYPWTVAFAFGSPGRGPKGAAASAALAALSAIQIQILAFSLVTMLLGAVRRDQRETPWRVASAVFACVLALPQLIALAQPDVLGSLQSFKTAAPWEYNNSSPLLLAFISQGYSPHYYVNALSAAGVQFVDKAALWVLLAAGILSFLSFVRNPIVLRLSVLWLLSFTLVSGVYGPIGGVLLMAFQRLAWLSVFRELYHFAGPQWTLLCLIVASLGKRLSPSLTAVLTACFFLMLAAPWIPANFAGQLVSRAPSVEARNTVQALQFHTGDDRVLMIPSEWPVGPPGRDYGGEDPLAYAIGNHPTANGYTLHGILEAAAAYTEAGDPKAKRWRAIAGIGEVVSRSDIRSYVTARFPPLHHIPPFIFNLMHSRRHAFGNGVLIAPTCMLCAYDSIPVLRDVTNDSVGDAFVLLSDASDKNGQQKQISTGANFKVTDPSLGWVPASQWEWLDPRIALFGSGMLTWSNAELSIPATANRQQRAYIRVLLLHGKLLSDVGALKVPLGRPVWVSLPKSATKIHVYSGLAVIGEIAPVNNQSAPAASTHFRPVGAALSFSWVKASGNGIVPAGTRFIVLKQSFSPAWKLRMRKGRVIRHFVASGYANGWEVSTPEAAQIQVYYERGSLGDWLLPASLALWFAIASAAVALHLRENTV